MRKARLVSGSLWWRVWPLSSSLSGNGLKCPVSSRRRQGPAGSRRELVPHLHGRHHRLRAAGVWSHGHLHQMREEDERVPHLQAVRSSGRARLQVLSPPCRSRDCEGEREHGARSGLVPPQARATCMVCKAPRLPRALGSFPSLLILHRLPVQSSVSSLVDRLSTSHQDGPSAELGSFLVPFRIP